MLQIYLKITDRITEFFLEQGITQVTIQPEFYKKSKSTETINSNKSLTLCLMKCQSEGCKTSHCCPDNPPKVNYNFYSSFNNTIIAFICLGINYE